MNKISVVYCSHNEELNIEESIKSIKDFADEIIFVDLESTDRTVEIAKRMGAKIYKHENLSFVEPVRNFGILKTTGDWILILDPDEKLTESLKKLLKEEIKDPRADFYRIPRKNIIFGKWMKHTGWWPDFNIRFFKNGHVSWNEIIHSVPMTKGKGFDLVAKEDLAIIHNNYTSLDSYVEKMFRYSKVQAAELIKGSYKFSWQDLIRKPLSEFLSRFFAREGYKDGIHGLILSLLQSFSEFFVYLRVWESLKYKEVEIDKKEFNSVIKSFVNDIKWWMRKEFSWLKFL
ncbi:MAG: Glycosyl transferase family 2 [Candidatus Woesebacteria bacterium GW2011_GWA1_33_30]|uniref:Glycosyl transferase family 2 n=1 Tax=Candidatus Woesebacteria bacterium GW2011_GWA2_33_28 TaxID=1618561 RepID=A0A0F9ZV32_9BACT|nr:MAG: Glycosyl transferase family 2 [Candidatus Woesebacteria bacterium GW2011_GWA2_33_28]KKP49050.1 MAG: Glycosyl transferase family 2 [Candidatus Woesebacteria bacterium GW2011_GWA1_33_30]KKP49842.1 MAG: Glycosyl transferase family 2 [Microgenomates group bacterium GW2011_GWC1_33_32]KKP52642.1 MAG: Glycosyl transferase family 2 [Candidatus Woesebacteria bacterium GW2011_GWB1_33_38]KKP58819.1 MAG: Glycosyl transferase family 2 [Microgenomates group bacterium GW2011_GWD1_33_9]